MPTPMSVSAKNALQGLIQAREALRQAIQNNLDANVRAQVEIDRLEREIDAIVGEESDRTGVAKSELKVVRIDADKSAFLSDADVAKEEADKVAAEEAAAAAKAEALKPAGK